MFVLLVDGGGSGGSYGNAGSRSYSGRGPYDRPQG